MNMHVIM